MNKDEAFKFIHDHEQFLIDTKKKYGKTSVDEYLDETLLPYTQHLQKGSLWNSLKRD